MNQERKKKILEILLKEKSVSVRDLSQRLYTSEPSIRRDLCELEKQKLLRRIYGGAVLEEHSDSFLKIPFLLREMEDHDAKDIIAKKALEWVNDGDVIMLDASSSAYALIPLLSQRSNVTVITSGVKALRRPPEIARFPAGKRGGRPISSCVGARRRQAKSRHRVPCKRPLSPALYAKSPQLRCGRRGLRPP